MSQARTILSHLGTTDIFPRESQDEVALMNLIKIKPFRWQAGSRSNQIDFMVSGMDSNGAKDHMLLELLADEYQTPDVQLPCRVCSHVGLKSVMPSASLADQSPSAAFRAKGLASCPTCSLVQVVDADAVGGSLSALACGELPESIRSTVLELCDSRELGPDSLALEIAGSDYLRSYQTAGIPVLRIELSRPTTRKGESASDLPAIREPLSQELALQLVRNNQRADVVHVGPVFSQIEDLNGMASSLMTILKPDGVAVIQVPYLKDIVEHADVDLMVRMRSCFSLTALTQLLGQHGLEIVDVTHRQISGGAITVTAARFGTMSATAAVHEMMQDEACWIRDLQFLQSVGDALHCPAPDRRAA